MISKNSIKRFAVYAACGILINLFLLSVIYADDKIEPVVKCWNCNQKDEKGRKTGLWIEDDGFTEVYYKAGLRNGILKSYYPLNNRLQFFGEFKNGNVVGTWYFFNQDSHLVLIEKDISKNSRLTIMRDDGAVKMIPPMKSYVIEFYPNGMPKEEGIALYDKSVVINFFKKGKWKYYDEAGKLVRTVNENK